MPVCQQGKATLWLFRHRRVAIEQWVWVVRETLR
jgi:hypothetical protein